MSEQITPNPSVPSQVVAQVKFPQFINNLGIIPTSYKDSMSYYECLAWLCKFLEETVIPTVNENGEATEELQQLYVELNNYVTNYFDNLDVQEEINNKLDDMTEAGTLEEIISAYLNSQAVFGYDNVADMKQAENLINGSYARTLGYYEINDGGGSLYKIRTREYGDIDDEGAIVLITDDIVAELVPENYVCPEQFGAYGDNTHNDATPFLNCFNYAKTKKIPMKLFKQYYINSNITCDGESGRVDIIQETGHLKIDGQIIITQIYYSDIKLKLNGGGSGDIDTYGVIFRKIRQCKFDLMADEVNKTAFYMNSEKSPVNTEIKFVTVRIRGRYNLRTLLHGSSNSSLGDGFGNYIDIVDGSSGNPVKFVNCRDVNIQHYENYFVDQTFQKNSVELINAGIRCSLFCIGGHAKNLLYIEGGGSFHTDFLLLINEQEDATQVSDFHVTGVYIKGGSRFTANVISSTKCLYTVNATEMTNQNLFKVDSTFISQSTPRGQGILLPDIAGNNLILSTNPQEKFVSIDSSASSETIDLSHLKFDKFKNMVHVNGYFSISENLASGTHLFDLGATNKSSYLSYGYMRQAIDKVHIIQVPNNNSYATNLNGLNVDDGANIYVDLWYRTRKES